MSKPPGSHQVVSKWEKKQPGGHHMVFRNPMSKPSNGHHVVPCNITLKPPCGLYAKKNDMVATCWSLAI